MGLYVKASCDALTDPKFLRVGPEGFTLYMKGLMHSKQHLTDGFVPDEALSLIGIGIKSPKRVAQSLIDADLWIKVEGGYEVGFDKWSKHQTTKEEVDEKRKANAERKRRSREAKKAGSHAEVTPMSQRDTSDVTEGGHAPVTAQSETEPETEPESLNTVPTELANKSPGAPSENHAWDPVARVVYQAHERLSWPDPKDVDIRKMIRDDSPIWACVEDYGEDGAVGMFVHAHANWSGDKRPTWHSVAGQRHQLWEAMHPSTILRVEAGGMAGKPPEETEEEAELRRARLAR